MEKIYACIDLKSFYASVECRERNLDPLKTNLVVADSDRTEKTICLAVSPSLKSYGLSGRARLFEVVQKINRINYERKKNAYKYRFSGKSYNIDELKNNKNLEIDYIVARPRMSYYIKYSTDIYNIYLKYLSEEDIYVYSIDEVFCDITNYLKFNQLSPNEMITMMIKDVYDTMGITATAGIGSNMYLAKVAMDVVAKHTEANEFGVRIAQLDEINYRKMLWNYKPLTAFWRVGKGYEKKLNQYGIYTMGDIARCSLENEELLYKLFGKNAELLIDHAWGYESCTMQDIKKYKPNNSSISSGQVLHIPYDYKKTRLVVKEMIDLLSLDLVSNHLVTDQLVLTIGYDVINLTDIDIMSRYDGDVTTDYYGRKIPKHAHGTINLDYKTSSSKVLRENMIKLYDRIINKNLLVRRINVVANNVVNEDKVKEKKVYKQMDLFTDYEILDEENNNNLLEENRLQHVLIDIKNKYGKNAILKGMNIVDGATTRERNGMIGGHRG